MPLLRIKSTSSSMMSHPNLLGHHPQSFTSFCATPPQPHLTTRPSSSERASLTGIRIHSSTTSLEGKSGCLADSFLLTAVEQERDPRGHQPARRFSCSWSFVVSSFRVLHLFSVRVMKLGIPRSVFLSRMLLNLLTWQNVASWVLRWTGWAFLGILYWTGWAFLADGMWASWRVVRSVWFLLLLSFSLGASIWGPPWFHGNFIFMT